MCGIVGLFNPRKVPLTAIKGIREGEPRRLCEGMLALIQHRGPDEMGLLHVNNSFIASARLSIVDLKGGIQPISNEDETLWIVYNGEIYDCEELRGELKSKGHFFRTQTDTEIILHLYEEYGEDFVDRLNGEYAFAILNLRENKLIIARDRYGIRPLYYRQLDHGACLFSSEKKSLLWPVEQSVTYDSNACAQTLESWTIIPPYTIYREIKQLPPNTVGTLDYDGHLKIKSRNIWTPTKLVTHDQAKIRATLEKAVQRRLVADVPVGVYLSGGLDSTLVSLLAVRNSKVPLKSFSIEFEDIGLDESEIQRELSHQLGTEHHAIRVSTKDIVENFVEAVLSAETLVFRSAFVPMFMLSKLVRESNIKTVLTGEGADELFGGYDIFKEFLILTDWATIGDDKEAASQLQKLYPYLPQFKDNRARFALPFYRAFLQDSEKSFFGHRVRWSNYRAMANLLAKKENITTGEALSTTFPEIKQHSQDCQCRVTELMTLLHGYLLSTQGDRMASANSVETRLPFLDEDVTKIAMNYTLREQLKGMNEKQQLRNAFLYDLPKLYNRKKRPYLAPDAEVFFKHAESFGLQDYFSKESIASHGVFDPEEVTTFFLRQKEIYEQGRRLSRRDNTAFFTILSAMILHNHMPSRLNPKNITHLIKRSIIL